MSNKHRRDSFLQKAQPLQGDLFLGMNNLPKLPATSEDENYVIGHGYDERPDLLAHAIYGNSRLWWVFAIRNPNVIKDPIRDFKAGTTIVLPSEGSVSMYNQGSN